MGLPLLEGWMLSSQMRFARVCSRKNGLLHSTVNPHTWSFALMAIFLPSSLPCCNMLQADGATQTWAKAAPTEQNISLFFMKHPVSCILLQQHKVNWGRLSLMFPVKTVLHMVLSQLCHAGHLWFLLVRCVFEKEKSYFAFSFTEFLVVALNRMCSVPLCQFGLMLKEPSNQRRLLPFPNLLPPQLEVDWDGSRHTGEKIS